MVVMGERICMRILVCLVSCAARSVRGRNVRKLTSLGRSSMFMGMEAMLGMSIVIVLVVCCKEAIRPTWLIELGWMVDEESKYGAADSPGARFKIGGSVDI